MKPIVGIIFLWAVLLGAPFAFGAEKTQGDRPMSKEELDRLKDLEDTFGTLRELKATFDKMIRERCYACLQAFGHSAFCECLNNNPAVGLGFKGYILAVTSTKEELGYVSMSEEDRGLVNSALKVREQCIRQLGFR